MPLLMEIKSSASVALLLVLAAVAPSSVAAASCPTDAASAGVCVVALGGLLNLTVGSLPVQPCCSLVQGLVSFEAAACLCYVLRPALLTFQLNVPVTLSLILNSCGVDGSSGYICAP